jgi:predicted Co/Zn/Cd cation transporter (cation efflux family)
VETVVEEGKAMAFGLAVTYLVVAVLVTAGLYYFQHRRGRWRKGWADYAVVAAIGATWPLAVVLLALYVAVDFTRYVKTKARRELVK